MEHKTLPIGTVVSINGAKAIVVGYDFDEPDNRLTREYVILPYPKGYGSQKDFKVVPCSDIEVIQRGFENDQYHAVATFIDGIDYLSETMNADELKKTISESVN